MPTNTKSAAALALNEAKRRVKAAKQQVKLLKAQLKLARGAVKAAKRARDEAELLERESNAFKPAKRAASRKKEARAPKVNPAPVNISVTKLSSLRSVPRATSKPADTAMPMPEQGQADAMVRSGAT